MIVVDAPNVKESDYAAFVASAKASSYVPFVASVLEQDVKVCAERSAKVGHGRTEQDIARVQKAWVDTPASYAQLSLESLYGEEERIAKRKAEAEAAAAAEAKEKEREIKEKGDSKANKRKRDEANVATGTDDGVAKKRQVVGAEVRSILRTGGRCVHNALLLYP